MLLRGQGYFDPLENTALEVEAISELLSGDSSILEGEEATEAAFRQDCGSYALIHLATHGNFSAQGGFIGDDLTSSRRDFALSRSVVLLAGGNRHLHDPLFDPSAMPDGLLSAREVSRLRTMPADLVVLSACQSGKGVVTPDGISGMLNAWKMAGAGTLVSSLWNVDDEATAFFMRCFYEALSAGKPVKAAFDEARNRMLEPVEKTILRFNRRRMRNETETVLVDWSAPRYRNAFILTDDV
jgi:CHAT domain-containing protein